MSHSTTKTSMYISPTQPQDGAISLSRHPDMYMAVSFGGGPNLGSESNLSRYHIAPEDFNHLLRYLIGSTRLNPLVVKGRVFDYTDNWNEFSTMNRKYIHIPSSTSLYDLRSFLYPIRARTSGQTDLETVRVINTFLTPDLITDQSSFTPLNDYTYDFIKANFLYPVAIRRFGDRNRPWIFEFYDVLAAIVNHPRCRCSHFILRNRQNCTVKDLVPIRQGLDAAAYQKYTNVYTILRSISYDYTRFLQPKRLFISNTGRDGNAFEFVAISQIEFRDEYNSRSTLPHLQADEDSWSNDLMFSDLNQQLQCYGQLYNYFQNHGHFTFSLQNDNMHIVLDPRLSILFDQKQSADMQQRNQYYIFCLDISTIFMTPLSLYPLPRDHQVIVIPDEETMQIPWVPGAHSAEASDEIPLLRGLDNDYLQRRNQT